MLVASIHNQRVVASTAQKGPSYICPGCGSSVILKKGTVVIHHFAHKTKTNCVWAKGETREHMWAKNYLAQSLQHMGWQAFVEYSLNIPLGDRRADVATYTDQNQYIAFEIQHSSIGLTEIAQRAAAYASQNIAQLWIPIIKPDVWTGAIRKGSNCYVVEKFPASKYLRWIHGFAGGHGMWMFDPVNNAYWLGKLTDYIINVPVTNWREGGEEQSGGGFSKRAKRWKNLTLIGPYQLNQLAISIDYRKEFRTPQYHWPAGAIVRLVPINSQ